MSRDPTDKNLLHMEARRFVSRCDAQIFSIERADNLRQANALIGALAGFPHNATPKSRRWRDGKFYDRTAHQVH